MATQHESLSDYQDLLSGSFDQMTEISSGGGGIIIKAHHKGLDKDVIIKKVIRSKIGTLGKTGERDALKNLKHSCLPQIYDYFEYGDDVFTVMEYIPGESFAQILARNDRKFKNKDLIKWTSQLCDVVNYLHSRTPAIIHCDIKPANVMLTPEGNICLIDFNISGIKNGEDLTSVGYTPGYAPAEQFFLTKDVALKRRNQNTSVTVSQAAYDDATHIDAVDEATQIDDVNASGDVTVIDDEAAQIDSVASPQNVSTPAPVNSYAQAPAAPADPNAWTVDRIMAFVQRNGIKARIDERTDIYSIGATLYHIATGVKPAPFYETIPHVQTLNPSIPDGLAFIIQKAMALKPQDRFSDCASMLKMAGQIHRLDKRYKRFGRIEAVLILLCGILMVSGILLSQRGMRMMDEEKNDRYNEIVDEMAELREDGYFEDIESLYLQAVELAPDKPDAYFEKGLALYQAKQYEDCIYFINDDVLSNEAVYRMDTKGSFYYLVASSYFELEEYRSAIDYFKEALDVDSHNVSYYRDYVISMARNGDIDGAEDGLKDAEKAGVEEDILMLLEGEIYFADGKYSQAQDSLIECLESSKDDEVLLRAYSKLDDVLSESYGVPEQYDIRAQYLEEAMSRLPVQSRIILMERLAQVYMDHSDASGISDYDKKALDMFGQIRDAGYGTFQTDYNIAVLYEKLGMYDDAVNWSLKMIDERGDNYRWYKRLSFAELQRQNLIENAKRDYSTFKEYYDQAVKLYKENSNGSDSEMMVLDSLYTDLVDMGWLN